MKCQGCGWEGAEDELVEREGDLTPNDRTLTLIFFMGVTRTDLCCPKCGRVLQSRRNLYKRPQPPDYP
jgi:predicted RNA-binding Zn-ribbon protein involved in translation (DUF1610 family)